MIVELRPDEITVCEVLGRMRSLIARSANVKDAKMGDQDGSQADVIGFAAEYAFAKFNNVFPDIGLSPRSGSADGVSRKGARYDVKATTYKTGKLLCTLKENDDVDFYVLAVVDLPKVEFKGWALKDELRKEENINDLGHGKGYVLSQEKLRKFQ